MRALSIRQPWAWLIVNGHKDVENRDWETLWRGRFAVHAGKTLVKRDYRNVQAEVAARFGIAVPDFDSPEIHFGGVVGTVELVGVKHIESLDRPENPWFTGPFGLLLARPERMPFVLCKGQLGWFDVDLPRSSRGVRGW